MLVSKSEWQLWNLRPWKTYSDKILLQPMIVKLYFKLNRYVLKVVNFYKGCINWTKPEQDRLLLYFFHPHLGPSRIFGQILNIKLISKTLDYMPQNLYYYIPMRKKFPIILFLYHIYNFISNKKIAHKSPWKIKWLRSLFVLEENHLGAL